MPEGLELLFAHVDAVHLDAAALDIVIPAQQVDQRALARAGGAHDRDGLAALGHKAHVVQHHFAAVGKGHMVEFHLALEPGRALGVLGLADRGAQIHIVEQLFRRGDGLGHHVDDVAQHAHGVGDQPDEAGGAHQGAQIHPAVQHEGAARENHDRGAQIAHQVHQRHEHRPDDGGPDIQIAHLQIVHAEGLALMILPGKGLDHPHARQVFLGSGVQNRVLLADIGKGRANALVEFEGGHRQQRTEHRHDQGQLPGHGA